MPEYTRKRQKKWLIVVLVFLIFVIVGLSISLAILSSGSNDKVSIECTSVMANVDYGNGGEDYAMRLSSEIADKIEEETDDYSEQCAIDDYIRALEDKDEKTRFYVAIEYANFLVMEDDVEGAFSFFSEQDWNEFADVEMKIAYYETLRDLFEINDLDGEAGKYDEILDSLYDEIGDTPIDVMENV